MRKPTACTQCRRMKLACNGERPCRRCISRNRVALCKSHDSNAAAGKKTSPVSQGGSSIRSSQAEYDASSSAIASVSSAGSTKGITIIDSETGEIVFIGQCAPMLYVQSVLSDAQKSAVSLNAILSAFLLKNESTLHPFGTLWRPGFDLTDVFEALPENVFCLKYFENYREASKHYLPPCIDFVDFEQRMCLILQRRGEIGIDAAIDQSLRRETIGRNAWCGLWFAVLAAGCQWSELTSSELNVTIKVFVACSFECLRRAQMYACNSLETLQTRLLLETVMCNAGNPGLAWILLGQTWRQAYGIGLSMPESSLGPLAQSLWHSVMEFDAAISYAYSRLPLAALTCRDRIRHSACHDELVLPLTDPKEASKRLHYLRMDFQNIDWQNITSDARIEYLDQNLGKVEVLISLALKYPVTTASDIKDMEIFKIIALQFKADQHRLLYSTDHLGSVQRMRNYEEAKVHYHQVLLSFDRLIGFEEPGRLSWTIRQSVTSSALVLAALDSAGSDSKYKDSVRQTISALEAVPILENEVMDDLRGGVNAAENFKNASALVWALYENT